MKRDNRATYRFLINSIEIITEEEFDKKFEEGFDLLKTYHYKHK